MVVLAVESVGIANLVLQTFCVHLKSCLGLGTGSVVLAQCAAEVCRLWVLVSKG